MGDLEDEILASLATKKKADFDKKPEDQDFSEFLPSQDQLDEIAALETPGQDPTCSDSEQVLLPSTTVISPSTDRDLDYDYARKNLKEIIKTSKEALDGIKNVAEQTNHPRAYEVVALITNALVEANKKLMDVHKQRQDLEIKEKESLRPAEKAKVTNNNLFVGSSSQLLEFVKNLHKDGTGK